MGSQDISFVGRGERRVSQILGCLFKDKATIVPQVHIKGLIKKEDYDILGPEHNQHKFDFVIMFHSEKRPDIVGEVNYKHKNGATKKWNNVYYPAILKADKIPVTISDYECKSIFDVPHERPLRWMDFIDVITALDMVRIKP